MIDVADFAPLRSTVMAGQAGEYLTSYILIRAGLQVVPVDVYGPDLWCRYPDKTVKTVEVKTATIATKQSKTHTMPSYAFTLGDRSADIFAFVALDKERVLFKRPEDLPSYNTVRFYQTEFSLRNTQKSLGLILPEFEDY